MHYLYESRSLAATEIQQMKKALIYAKPEEEARSQHIQKILFYLQKVYPDKFIIMDFLIQFSTVPHDKILEYFKI